MPEVAEATFHARFADPRPPRALLPETRRCLEALRVAPPGAERGRWRNNNVDIPWEPDDRVWSDPSRRDELDAIVRQDQGARVLSTCWSMSTLSHPRPHGGVVLTRPALGVGASLARLEGQVVRCALGATFHDVFRALEGTGRALANQPGFAHLSVVGSIGCGGHGSGLRLGPMLDEVVDLEIDVPRPAPSGERLVVTRAHPDFALHAIHLGRLGPVTGIRLRTTEAFHVAESRAVLPLGAGGRDWRRGLRVLLADTLALQRARPNRLHSMELWIAPYPIDGVLTVALGVRERTRSPLSPPDVQRPAALRERALVALGESVAVLLAQPGLREGVPWVIREAVRAVATCPPVIMTSERGLDFGAPNDARMGAIEAAVPADRGADAVIATIELLGELAAGPAPHLVFAPMGVRFVGEGPDTSLSPHTGRRETVHIEVPTFGADEVFGGQHVLAPVQTMLARRFQGRPHWGQRVYLAPDTLRGLWPEPAIARMAALVRERDPRGDFASPLLDAVLGV